MFRVKERPKTKLEFSEKIMYDGARRHTPLHSDKYIKMMPNEVQPILIEQNDWAEQMERKKSILYTPHPVPYE